jgi:hypothetical protein
VLADEAVAAVVAFATGAFLVVPPVTPFLIVPMTVRFVVAGAAFAAAFFTTVEVLLLLDSLILLVVRAAATFEAAGAAALLVLGAVVPVELALVVDVVVVFRVAAPRVAFAFSTMFERRLVGPPARVLLAGEAGRVIWDFAGTAASRALGARREFDEAGERT